VTAAFDVTNTGQRDGDEIVQLYVHCAAGNIERPIRQLANFERVHLKAGETRRVTLDLPHDHQSFWYWDEVKEEFATEPGPVEVMIGTSSAEIRLRDIVQLTA
jgi:beta-glucosidase